MTGSHPGVSAQILHDVMQGRHDGEVMSESICTVLITQCFVHNEQLGVMGDEPKVQYELAVSCENSTRPFTHFPVVKKGMNIISLVWE